MKSPATCALTCCALLILSPVLMGQVFEVGMHGGASRIQGKDIGTLQVGPVGPSNPNVTLENGWRIGFRVTVNNWTHFGHEFGYAYNRTQFRVQDRPPTDYGTAIHQGFYDFLAYARAEGSRVRPFLAGGGHFSNFIWPGGSVTYGGGDSKFGVNYGGGIKIRLTPIWGIRFDVREYYTGKPFDLPNADGNMRHQEFSAGFSLMI